MTRVDEEFEGAERAWKEFRAALADRIARHDETDHILWELEAPERTHESATSPYIQVTWSGPNDIVAEVASNRVLHPRYRVSRAALARLRRAGWNATGSGHLNYWREVDPRYADQVASQLVDALRTHFDVVHPAFLIDGCAEYCATVEAQELLAPDIEEPSPPHLPVVVMPTDRDHLVRLVDQALGTDWDRPTPVHDDDGDIPYLCGDTVVFVQVLPQAPAVRVFAELVVDVGDQAAAQFEVSVLNRDHGGIKFSLNDDIIWMSVDIQALPFVPAHLRGAVDRMCRLASELDGVVTRRVSGRPFIAASEDDAA